MRKGRKREKKRKTDKKIIAFLSIIVFFIVIVVYQATIGTPLREPISAEEYFQILEPIPSGSLNEDGSHLLLNYLTFKIKAVGGDAHEVIANSGGSGMQDDTWVGTIMNGEEKTVFLSFESLPISLHRTGEENFSMSLQITSVEASGWVTIDFPPPLPA